MKKVLIVAAALTVGSTSMALASIDAGRGLYRHHTRSNMVLLRSSHRVAANGRCGGMSYGTGARSCGTATGGPVGGLSNRN